jgi:hypothetical protein
LPIDANSQKVLSEAFRLRQSVFISGDGLPITFQTFIVATHSDHLLLANRIKPRYVGDFICSHAFSLQVGMVRFQSDRVSSDGENIVFPLKDDSVIEETRQAERFSFTADERVIAEILNPFDGETRLSKSVMDMSATGLSLRTTFESKLFQPDTYLPNMRILIDGELYKKGPGRVVYRRKLMDLGGQMRTQVGVKFES